MSNVLSRLKKVKGLTWASIAMVIIFAIIAQGFLSRANIEMILKNSAILMVVSVGMTMAILSQQIDLSIGGTMTIAAMVAAYYIKPIEAPTMGNIIITCLIGIAVGVCVGVLNGILIAVFKFNFWLATFATMSIGYGLAQGISGGLIVSSYAKIFRSTLTGKSAIFGISNLIWIALVVMIIMMIVLKATKFGYHVYAVGDSEQSARLSGIHVTKIRMLIYTISGALAGFGGVLLIAKTNSATASVGSGYEFDAIAACIIGGTSFDGGKGGLGGTIFGALILAAFKSGLQLIGLDNYWQKAFVGFFILAIIVADVLSVARREKEAQRRIYK